MTMSRPSHSTLKQYWPKVFGMPTICRPELNMTLTLQPLSRHFLQKPPSGPGTNTGFCFFKNPSAPGSGSGVWGGVVNLDFGSAISRLNHSLLASVNSFLASFVRKVYYTCMEHTELARLGGIARAEKLSPQRRKQIARKAGKAGGRGRRRDSQNGNSK